MKTTLNQIRKHKPCPDGWGKLLRSLGKTEGDDEPLSLTTILDSNGIEDALWCLRAVDGHEREIRLFAVWCARQVQHLMTDTRSIAALDVAERYANGLATKAELTTAWATARATARDAADATARAAARDAADATARGAARAAWAAAWAAAGDAVEDAAWATARAAAGAAAGDAVEDAAWATARASQEVEFRRICTATKGERT